MRLGSASCVISTAYCLSAHCVVEILTVSGHPHHQTLLEAALLAAVPVDPHDGAALVLKALLVLDVLLDAPSEEALHVDRDRRRRSVHASFSKALY